MWNKYEKNKKGFSLLSFYLRVFAKTTRSIITAETLSTATFIIPTKYKMSFVRGAPHLSAYAYVIAQYVKRIIEIK